MRADQGVIPIFCMVSYLSLIAYESFNYLTKSDPSVARTLALEYGSVVAQSRHRIKLFDDSRLGMDGVSKYFGETLASAHQRRFLGNTWLPFARRWETDLGLYIYAGRLISTTHVAHFNLGTAPSMLDENPRELLRGIGADMGRYFGGLAKDLDWYGQSFLMSIESSKLVSQDVRSWDYYGRAFGGGLNVGLAAALTAFCCSMNTLDTMLPLDNSKASDETSFKLRFVTLYHVLAGLRELLNSPDSEFTDKPRIPLSDIDSDPISALFLRPSAKLLRNTLVHYGLDSRLPMGSIDPSQPLAGLVGIYYDDLDFAELSTLLKQHTHRVARLIDDWAAS
ncbi:MAG TPA: hypothetical protein VH682_25585 [Gemmataceae bacterium]